MTDILTAAAVVLFCAILLPLLTLASLKHIKATDEFSYDMSAMRWAAFIGAILMGACALRAGLPLENQVSLIILGSLLLLGAWIDRISAYAPDAIIMPFCILIFLVGFDDIDPRGMFDALLLGVLLYVICIALWIPQEASGYRVVPPVDVAALAAPFILFGVEIATFAVYLASSVVLIAILRIPSLAPIFSKAEAVKSGAQDVHLPDRPAVTFLSVAFPIIFVAKIVTLLHISQ